MHWRPTDWFIGTLAATSMDPVYDSFVSAEGPNGPVDLSGKQVPGIHELSLVTAGRFSFNVGNGDGYVRVEYLHESDVQVISNTPESVASRKVGTLNASAGIAWNNGLELMIWGRNINNDEYLMSAFPSVAQQGSYSGYPNQPRTYGLTLRKYFN